MRIFFGVIHILICVALIAVVMMQHRKAGGFSGAFGGGGTQADMSAGTWQRMSGLTKITTGLIIAFMVVSIIQAVIA
ncbi:MAG: preprotein translocase subunit SecG [Synergistes sp.]|nr:preprotein translocase subunit SecG [Synergistes sp.]